ncbi:VCBS domain-containing protein [Bradyrhizobium sp. CIAT3101]|uniref:VCBS domain-containing protein n=1 Tax=Bradyrhizobium sp. CIAT3101 TaxID=439387 RepID=UPI0024B1A2D0|nr:VCBS domain-containing protein [Bradyrhizobium sp. CIAT3101]WFU84044.1 VCBS domain-containing protein [Bradyrhizobium sp. CIAT3101]
MFGTSTARHGDEREAAAAPHRQVRTATSGALDAPATQIRERASAGGFGMLSLTALLLSMIKEVEAADPNVTFLDDDTIAYKDLAHGAFELTTKEAIPRHIIVEDPGQTVVLSKVGSGVSVNQLDNSATRMEELRAVQQEALENFAKGYGTHGSGTPPFVKSLPLEPIHFIAPDAPAAPNALPAVPVIMMPEIMIVKTPPTLNAQAPPLELDTAVFDVFTATRGTFSASSSSSNAALTFAISGGAPGNTVLDGATYDVSKTSAYGTLYLNSTTGAYAFVPDNDAINALKTSTTDSFVIAVSDGSLSAQQVFTININGVDDAAIISGITTGTSIESGGVANASSGSSVTTGKLSDVDVDDPANTFTAVNSPTPSAHGYGTFTMTADGVWAYTLDQSNSAVQALNIGQTLTDTFTVTSIGGTPQLITITINGSNDAAIISGTATGTVTEAAYGTRGTPTATGRLTDTDVDNTPDSFTPVTSPKVSDHGYGSFQMTADGVWTYLLDNANCAVQALNACDTLTDTFTVTTIDGTAQVVTITIHGTNDPAIIRGCTTGSVTEPDCEERGKPTASGRLTDTDVDNPPNTFTPVTCATRSAGGYGTFTMTAAGVWTYTLDTTNCAVKALSSCDTLTDTFAVTTIDGTEQTIAITIHGADDRDHFGHAAAHDAAAPPHAAAIPEDNTAADGFAAVQTVAASTHDARTGDTAVSGESPDDGKISSQDSCDARSGGYERNLLASSSRDDHFVFASTSNPGAARPDIVSGFKIDSERIDLTALGVDRSIHSGTGPIETSHHENQLLEQHHRDPTGENDLPRVAWVRLGDSFHFKQPAPDGSGVLAPEPRHAAAEPHATEDGALRDHRSGSGAGLDDPSDPSGHHEHAGVVHGFGAAPMPELSPLHIDPAHGPGSTHALVPHDLIV